MPRLYSQIDLKENKRQKAQESVNGVVVDRDPGSAYEQRVEVKPTDIEQRDDAKANTRVSAREMETRRKRDGEVRGRDGSGVEGTARADPGINHVTPPVDRED